VTEVEHFLPKEQIFAPLGPFFDSCDKNLMGVFIFFDSCDKNLIVLSRQLLIPLNSSKDDNSFVIIFLFLKFEIFVLFLLPTVKKIVRGDQEGLFKLVTLDRVLNRITGVTSGCWWLVVVNAIPISDICQINQQNISSCSVINNRIKNFSQLYYQLKQSFLITRYIYFWRECSFFPRCFVALELRPLATNCTLEKIMHLSPSIYNILFF
jgi:hypothetical protein